MSYEDKLEPLEKIGAGTVAILYGTLLSVVLYLSIHTKEIKNPTITNVGTYHLVFYGETIYLNELQKTINVDFHDKCLRPADKYFKEKDKDIIGQKIKSITYRYGFSGPCDYIEDLVLE
ncbi:hypothetical protein HQ489_00855 [Candidatus Woesearchaeota archaeon]|nr:hypothetical protein [Candidatus Woesearchaeota archaeon]